MLDFAVVILQYASTCDVDICLEEAKKANEEKEALQSMVDSLKAREKWDRVNVAVVAASERLTASSMAS